jgi:hypothetical protein
MAASGCVGGWWRCRGDVVHCQPTRRRAIGRDSDVEAACRLLERDEVRLFTIIDPAGSGKTRLAMCVVVHSLSASNGVIFMAFAQLRCEVCRHHRRHGSGRSPRMTSNMSSWRSLE